MVKNIFATPPTHNRSAGPPGRPPARRPLLVAAAVSAALALALAWAGSSPAQAQANSAPTITTGHTTVEMLEADKPEVDDYDATDPEGDTITWSVQGTDAGDFQIDANGVLRFQVTPDFENPLDHNRDNEYKVKVRATAAGGYDTRDVTVTVTNVPTGEEPVVINGPASVKFQENKTGVLGRFTATDPNSGTITWSLSTVSGPLVGSVEISQNGVLSLTSPLDYEANGNDVLNVDVVVTSSTNQLGDRHSFLILLTDVNEPPILRDGTDDEMYEGGNNNQLNIHIGNIEVTDPEGDAVTWSLTGPDANDFIWSDHIPGNLQLWFKETPDYESPKDSNKDNEYKFTVRASAKGGVSTTDVTVTVKNVVDEEFVVVSGLAHVTLNENQTGVLATYTATDPEGGAITWSVEDKRQSSGDASFFTISPAGVLSLSSPTNFEAKAEKQLEIRVVADSASNAFDGALDVKFNANNVNEAFAVTEPASASERSKGVNENRHDWGFRFEVSDPDNVGQFRPVWQILGADAADFTIDDTGNDRIYLRFKFNPDYESPRDSNGDNEYRVTMRAYDGAHTIDVPVTILVRPIDEGPEFTGPVTPQFRENATGNVGTYRATDPEGEAVQWRSLAGADAAAFSLSSNGVLKFNSPPDFETQSSYSVTLRAQDVGTASPNRITHTETLDVTVKIVDVNEAPTITSGRTDLRLSENDTDAFQYYAAVDPESDNLTWSVVGTDGHHFIIDANSGGLSFRNPPDYERPGDSGANNVYNLTVRAGDGSLYGTRDVTVTVDDVNEAPTITSGPTAVNFRENSTANVGTYRATDPEGGTIYWSVIGDDGSEFEISEGGVLTLRSPPDRETKDSYSVKIIASDEGGLEAERNLEVTITDQNEAPSITRGRLLQTDFALQEGDTTLVGSFAATDPEDNPITWSVTGTDAGQFQMDADGDLSFRQMPDFETPRDNGRDNIYNVTVKASASGGSDTVAVTVTVSDDTNEGVAINGPGKLRFAENGTGTLHNRYTATDPDGGDITWSLARNAPSQFSVSANGTLSVTTALDRETQSEHLVELIASSTSGGIDTLNIKVSVIDVNEAPTVTVAGIDLTYTENDTESVYTYQGTDPEDDDLIWSIRGTDASRFTIDRDTGELSFRTPPDFERPIDSGGNNVYNLTVRASDGRLYGDLAVEVTVTGVDEAPTITSGPTAVDFRENSTANVGIYRANDPEGATVQWELSGTDASAFTITSDGVLKFASPPDFETKPSYTVSVDASDGSLTGSREVAVTILDVNEPPAITGGTDFDYNEDGTAAVATFAAVDPEGLSITWDLIGTDRYDFIITPAGVLWFKASPDFEGAVDSNRDNEYLVTVRARAGYHYTNHNVVVTVLNVNETPTITGADEVDFDENSTANVTTLTASDPDGDDLTLTVDDTGTFSIDADGVLTFNSPPDYESQNSYTVTITASDGTLSDIHSLTIAINDVTNEPPTVTGASTKEIEENSGTFVECYSASDQSGNAIDDLTLAGTDGGAFELDQYNCLEFTTAPDYDDPDDDDGDNEYEFLIQATDSNGVTGSLAVVVTVTGVDEAPVITGLANPSFAENGTGAVGSYSAADPEGGSASLTMSGSDAESFTFTNGELAFKSPPDYELGSRFYYVDFTSSDGDLESTLNVTVEITNVNEAPSVTGDATQTIEENDDYTEFYYSYEDPENDSVTWSVGGADGALFEVSAYGTLSFTAAPDYESPADADDDNVYEVTVSASDDSLTSAALTVKITVQDVDEAPIISGAADPSFDENATGTIDTYSAEDPEGEDVTLTLSGYDASSFNFDATTGALTFASPPDFESASSYSLEFIAVEDDNSTSTSSLYVTVTVNDVDEAPTIDSGDATHDYTENGTGDIGYYTASDPEGDPIVWSLEGTDAEALSIDEYGNLSFVSSPDRESKDSYSVTVKVTGGNESATMAVTVNITDVDEAPTITGPTVADIDENATGAVGTYSASDPEDGTVTLTVAGPDAASFSIVNGVLSVTSPGNYEVSSNYNVVINANDGTNTSTLAVRVSINDVNEAPEITSGGATHSHREGVATVATYEASDPENLAITWSLEGADAGDFTISSGGVLSFSPEPNFELPADADTDNVYAVTVKATAGGESDTVDVQVTVTNVDESPDIIGLTEVDFDENGTGVVATYSAVDPEGADATLSLGTGLHSESFTLSGGELRFIAPPDFEDLSEYRVRLEAVDESDNVRQIQVDITVIDVDEPPTVTGTADPSVIEGATQVGTYAATDPEGDTISWSISGEDAGDFTFTAGALSFTSAPDYDSPADADTDNVYEVTLTATANGKTGSMDVTVTVNEELAVGGGTSHDYDENGTGAIATFTTNAPAGTTVTWSLEGDDASNVSIDSNGALSFLSPPNFESPGDADEDNTFSVTVKATVGSQSATLAVSVNVVNVNEAPYFVEGRAPNAVTVVEGYGGDLRSFSAGDVDSGGITFTLHGTDSDLFSLEFPFGEEGGTKGINLNAKLIFDYEAPQDENKDNVYEITIRASDSVLSTDLDVEITIDNVNEVHTMTGPAGVSFPSGGTGTVASFSVTDPESATIPLTLGGTDAASFSISSGGDLTFKTAPNHQTKSSYSVTITADDGTHAVSKDVTVLVVDSQQTMTVSGTSSFTLRENTTSLSLDTYTAAVSGGGQITWSVEGTDAASFSISASGELSLVSSPDFETKNSYAATVKATAGSASVTMNITVTVTDAEDPGRIEGPSVVSFPHNGTGVVATFEATDDDPGDTASLYWYSDYNSSTDNGSFNFNTTTGELTFKSPPDYDVKRSYRVAITADHTTRHGQYSELAHFVTINILPKDMTVSGSSSETVAENATDLAVATYTATNPGTETLTWSVEGTDADDFEISSAGVLSFSATPDFENPADDDEDNSYSVTVKAAAGDVSATKAVVVTVTGVDEAPTIDSGPASPEFAEHGTGVVATYVASDPESDAITWSLEGTDAGDFTISSGGELSFSATPNHEDAADGDTDNVYVVTVKATANNKSATLAVSVTVTNVDEGPSIDSGGATHNYAENGSAAVATYVASDPEGDPITWTLEGDDADDFTITGGALSFVSSPDFEDPADTDENNVYVVTVKATANGKSATQAVSVTVTAVDEAPTIDSGPTTKNYAENGTAAVGTYTASDAESHAISWSLEGDDAGDFSISSDGELSFRTSPDFEDPSDADENNIYSVTVKATANNKSATRAVLVTVTAVDEKLTVSGPSSPSIDENATDLAVGTYVASNLDGETLVWSLEGNDKDDFSITTAGALSLKASPNFETKSSYAVTVKATAGTESATVSVALSVTNVDEPPTIDSGGATHNYAENGTAAVATYVASDPDAGASITWSLEGDDAGDFSITGGVLSFRSPPNFEAAADANTNNVYEVTVKATAGTKSDTLAVTVTVTAVDEAPSIDSGPTSKNYAENGTAAVGTYTASDPENDTITWSLEGDDAADFSISNTGELTFQSSPDFESPADDDADNVYEVTVKATSSGGAATRDVEVTVTAVDETLTVSGPSAPSITENATDLAVGTYVASNLDGETLVWSLEGDDKNDFTLTGGALALKASPNYETKSSYRVTVKATAGTESATLAVAVSVTNVDEPPAISSGPTTKNYAENGTGTVATYVASDPDAGDTITWTLEGDDAADFTITGGALSFRSSPDHEAPADKNADNVYKVTVKVTAGTKSDTLAVTVTVTAVDEGPSITSGPATKNYAENGDAVVGTYVASDPENDTITWTLEGDDAADFNISTDGVLSFASSPNFEAPADKNTDNVYKVTVKATSSGGTDTRAVTVTVTAVNEGPTIDSGATAPEYAENGTGVVETYTASDPEGHEVTWSVEGDDAADFTISSDGELSFNASPNYEAPADDDTSNDYEVTVKATSSGGTATLAVTVSVTNVDERLTVSGPSEPSIAENATDLAVGTYVAGNLDGETLVWSLEGTHQDKFTLTGGALVLKASPDYETLNRYLVTVKATAGDESATVAVALSVTNVDEAPTIDSGPATKSYAENGAAAVATYVASDPDQGDTITWTLEGDDAADFTITDGALSFASSPDFEAPADKDEDNVYKVTVKVTAGTKSDTLAVTVTVTNVVETLTVSGSSDHTIEENETDLSLGTYAASNLEGQTLVWSLEGADKDDFSITTAGALSLDESPDYEAKSSYSVTVKATAGTKSATKAVSVTVSDVDEAPSIDSGPATKNYAENGTTAVATYVASDPDEGDTIVWTLEGDDAGDFTITGGVLSFSPSPDFETPADADTDNVYKVTVKATAGTKSDTLAVTVTVTAVDEPPSIDSGPTTKNYAENGTAAVGTYTASDPEDDAISWSLEGDDAGDFSISKTGELTFQSSPDFEDPADADENNVYKVTVKATANNKSATRALLVTVTAEDETLTVTGSSSHTIQENESDLSLGTYAASNLDGETLVWSLEGDDKDDFSITTAGALSLDASPNYETKSSYAVTVKATAGTESATLAVAVTVSDVDEPPSITSGPATKNYAENGTAAVATYVASDPDAGDTIVWTLEGDDAADFTITGGALSFRSSPNYEAPADDDTDNDYEVTVKATSSGGTATRAVTVSVTDVDEALTVSGPSEPSIAENATDLSVGTYVASNLDGETLVWSLEGDDKDDFTLTDGALVLKASPNYEAKSSYDVTVKATAGNETAKVDVDLSVTDVDEPPSIDSGPATKNFAENGTSVVATYVASDPDAGDTIVWTLEGDDAADFTITGGALGFASSPDFENPADKNTDNVYSVTVKATSSGGTATQAVKVTVTAVDEGPSITSGPATKNYAENGSAAVGTYAASDPESHTVSWSLEGDDAADFTISTDGELSFASSPNFEAPADKNTDNVYKVTVKASSSGGTATQDVSVTVTGVNEPPTIDSGPATKNYAENGTGVVGTYTASDPEGDEITWSVEGTDAADFTISSDGELSFDSSPNHEAPADDDTDNDYEVTVKATSSGGTATRAVTVSVTNVDEALTVSGPSEPTIAENATDLSVGTYAASNLDGETLVWSLEGDDKAYFTLTSGALALKASPNYEDKSSYDVTVKATAGNESATVDVDLSVTNVDEPPTIDSGPATKNYAENGTGVVATYTASDPDASDTITWTLEGDDAADFTITNGALSFASTPDFEAPADKDKNNVYLVTVKATANGKSDTQAVTVTVTAVDEGPTIDSGPASKNYAENGTDAVATYVASDPESDTITWTLEGDDAGDFEISTGGVLSFASSPDFESPADKTTDNVYKVTVKATSSGGTATQDVSVTVTGVNEGSSIDSGEASPDYAENGTGVVETYTASDPEGHAISWTLEGDDAADFSISSDGELSFNASPNYEAPADDDTDNDYEVTVKATSSGGTATRAVTVSVTDVDEALTVSGPSEPSIAENATDLAVGTYVASNLDGETVVWSLEGDDKDDFSITAAGALSLDKSPNYETKSSYDVTVKATAGNETAKVDVDLSVTNVDEAPTIDSGGATHNYAENGADAVATYTASDPDAGDTITWSLEGDDAEDFTITGGALSFRSSPDYEAPADANTDNVYSVTVKVTAGTKSDTLAVTVTVTNVVETLTVSGSSDHTIEENETDLSLGTYAASNLEGQTLVWSLEGADKDDFSITTAGALSLDESPDYEAKSSYSVTVKATAGTKSATKAVTVTVTNVDETLTVSGPSSPSIEENATDLTVGTYVASNLDGQTVTWSLEGDDKDDFTITAAGVLSLDESPDYEDKNSYAVTVKATAGTETATVAVALSVTNVDEAPSIDSGGATHNYAENGTAAVATYVGSDPEDDAITWSVEGTDAGDFSISTDGALSFRSSPNYESPDDDENNVYVVTVKATANNKSATQSVTVTVTGVDEAPSIDSGPATKSYAENDTAAVATYAASDPENNAITWSLAGADAGDFTISDGELSFNSTPDFEAPADANTDNVYSVTVKATAGTKSGTLAVTVTVTDVDESMKVSGSSDHTIEENATDLSLGTYSVSTAGRATVTWTLEGTDKAMFTLSSTGALSLKAAPDFEAKSSYSVTVKATKGGTSATKDVAVTVTNVDEGPSITSGPSSATFTENDTGAVATYTASDPEGDPITWSVEGTDQYQFFVDAEGALRFGRVPNYEGPWDADQNNVYEVTVKATAGGKSATLPVTVEVIAVDEAPVITGGEATHSYVENDGSALTVYIASDPEGDAFTWSLGGPDADDFSIDAYGWLRFRTPPDFEAPTDANTDNVYEVTVKATANGLSGTKAVTVTVTDLDDTSLPGKVTLSTPSTAANRVQLNWRAPTDGGPVTGYQILRRNLDVEGSTMEVLVEDTGTTDTLYIDYDVTPSTRYSYRVKALNANGAGPVSTFKNATTGVMPPPGRTQLLTLSSTAGELTISAWWLGVLDLEKPTRPGADTYKVQWRRFSDSSIPAANILTIDAPATTAEITVDGTGKWVVLVSTCNQHGCSAATTQTVDVE